MNLYSKCFERARSVYPRSIAKNISVTHDEVNRGLLKNDKCGVQAIYFERTIEDIDAEMGSEDKSNNSLVAIFKDTLPDPDGKKFNRRIPDVMTNDLLKGMKEKCRDKMDQHGRCFRHIVPWIRGSTLSKDSKVPPTEWNEYLDSFGSILITTVCESLFDTYTKPVTDPLEVELVSQHNSVLTNIGNFGFPRLEVLRQLHDYIDMDSVDGKALVLYGNSGVGKSWLMSQFIKELGERHEEEKMTIFYRLLGTSPHSSDSLYR